MREYNIRGAVGSLCLCVCVCVCVFVCEGWKEIKRHMYR